MFFILQFVNSAAFRCFSEYEFTWWDGAGVEHINGFSMGHFQLKMKSHFRDGTTLRIPLREAFFLVRLHPTYRESLIEECPHAMIAAHLLVSLFSAESQSVESAIHHYHMAIEIMNNATRVHQEVALLAWPFRELTAAVERTMHERQSLPAPNRTVTIVFNPTSIDSFRAILIRLSPVLRRFATTRLVLVDDRPNQPIIDLALTLFTSVHMVNTSSSPPNCRSLLSVIQHIPHDWYPALFLYATPAPQSFDLMELYLQHVTNAPNSTSLPQFYSFGASRTMPVAGPTTVLKGSYDSGNFALGNPPTLAKVRQGLDACSSWEAVVPANQIWENVLRDEQGGGNHLLMRCDDPSLPVSLRLCDGNEHVRTEWRDTLLSPVLPRRAIVQID